MAEQLLSSLVDPVRVEEIAGDEGEPVSVFLSVFVYMYLCLYLYFYHSDKGEPVFGKALDRIFD